MIDLVPGAELEKRARAFSLAGDYAIMSYGSRLDSPNHNGGAAIIEARPDAAMRVVGNVGDSLGRCSSAFAFDGWRLFAACGHVHAAGFTSPSHFGPQTTVIQGENFRSLYSDGQTLLAWGEYEFGAYDVSGATIRALSLSAHPFFVTDAAVDGRHVAAVDDRGGIHVFELR